MTKRFLSHASFYSVAATLGIYLAHGQSATVHAVYVSTTLFATYMSRRSSRVQAQITRLPGHGPAHDDSHIELMAHVEEMLSHAS